ncbi:hypothetical protein [Roseivirga spongicola]|uniref:Uncharacterized protein n=1 Tax=Roseivirga spongicola TaxID=333140 RepID=A0A150XCH9_9BACT|nr:hypothetical protein [Roseivirga spongicola]KYG76418.1 hypothetical protein AWW68_19420 [Roseivirga spongicola]WPZ08737.1 hypothetical protein T7867_10755 [Roseivirga spongicola]
MNPEELRIGNLYNWTAEGNDYVFEVESKDFSDENYKNFEPIPLTDEWLTKLWFWPEKENHRVTPCCNYALVKLKDGYYIYNHSEVDGSLTWIRTNAIQYVHQLQNLYFALTGEELQLR